MRVRAEDAAIDFIAGSTGGVANVLVGQPLDTIKVKMQTHPSLYRSAYSCFKKTLTADGIWNGLYAGTGPAVAANVAENSVLFCCYGFCQELVRSLRNRQQTGTSDKALAGLAAGFLTSFVICPTELVKCKLQAARERGVPHCNTNMWSLTRDIMRKEGPMGLFRGLSVTMGREVPGFFFFFGAYELCKETITSGRPDDASLIQTIVSGAAGGVALWVTIFPLDVVKSRIQVHDSVCSVTTMVQTIVKNEGLYKGLTPTLIRTAPSTAALFVTYEFFRRKMIQLKQGVV